MELQQDEQKSRELSSQLVSIMTTEHYNLQTGRAMTISEANGRASLFVGAVSSGLIALALVAQLSRLSAAFFVFGLIVLPTLFFMGLITFERVLQSGLADVTYARGINRIRHLYLEYAPQMQPYFILGSHDDGETILQQESMIPTWVQSFLGMASMVAIITSVLAGSFLGMLFILFALPLWACIVAGGIGFLVSVVLLQTYQQGQWVRLQKSIPVNFPRQPKQ
ncbi:MAG TPA: hypothetical protein VEL31_19475 [Ktedonobacteraceae bacterium]|nr:hypothetical protein [Ktedonobacteraceae bacterium]